MPRASQETKLLSKRGAKRIVSPSLRRVVNQPTKQFSSPSRNNESIKAPIDEDIIFIDGFLSEPECSELLEGLKFVFWEPSLIYEKQQDGEYRNLRSPLRVSETAHEQWFGDGTNAILKRIEKRLKTLFGVDPLHLEPWQTTDYRRNGNFYYHLDAGYWGDYYAGERILTFLLYLNTPRQGGGTHFRALDTYVEARAGRLLVWNNLFPNGDCNYRMIHSSAPLLKGRKTTLVTWQRQRVFRIPK